MPEAGCEFLGGPYLLLRQPIASEEQRQVDVPISRKVSSSSCQSGRDPGVASSKQQRHLRGACDAPLHPAQRC
jgi:hypothetical protein